MASGLTGNLKIPTEFKQEFKNSKPRQTPHRHFVWSVPSDECSLQSKRTAEAAERTHPFQCWSNAALCLTAHWQAMRVSVSGSGRKQVKPGFLCLSAVPSRPVISKHPCIFPWEMAQCRVVPYPYLPPFSMVFLWARSRWPAVLSFRYGLFCDAHNSFPVWKRHATHLLPYIYFFL